MTSAKRNRPRTPAASLLIATLTLLLVAAPTWAEAEEGSAWDASDLPIQAYDVVFVRPVGLAGLAMGASLFVFAGPIGATYGQFDALWKLYVADPFTFTFRRSLGDFGF